MKKVKRTSPDNPVMIKDTKSSVKYVKSGIIDEKLRRFELGNRLISRQLYTILIDICMMLAKMKPGAPTSFRRMMFANK